MVRLQLVLCLDSLTCEQDYIATLPATRALLIKAVITKNNTGVKAKHMTHKASPIVIAK